MAMTKSDQQDGGPVRLEKDSLGELPVPASALYGVQTARALDNFQISSRQIHPLFITTYAEVKKAAALANVDSGALPPDKGDAIVRAEDEIIEGRWREHFGWTCSRPAPALVQHERQ